MTPIADPHICKLPPTADRAEYAELETGFASFPWNRYEFFPCGYRTDGVDTTWRRRGGGHELAEVIALGQSKGHECA
jgi:hypothetical protein